MTSRRNSLKKKKKSQNTSETCESESAVPKSDAYPNADAQYNKIKSILKNPLTHIRVYKGKEVTTEMEEFKEEDMQDSLGEELKKRTVKAANLSMEIHPGGRGMKRRFKQVIPIIFSLSFLCWVFLILLLVSSRQYFLYSTAPMRKTTIHLSLLQWAQKYPKTPKPSLSASSLLYPQTGYEETIPSSYDAMKNSWLQFSKRHKSITTKKLENYFRIQNLQNPASINYRRDMIWLMD